MNYLKLFFDFKLIVLIIISLLFLSANSILARMALITDNIDAFSFTFLRVFSGFFVLAIIYFYRKKQISISFKTNWISSFMLFLYAICFSYSYINMYAGIGTLILFAVVQLTMIFIAILLKEKITPKKIFGISIAFVGLFYLLYPKQDFTISYFHTFLMTISGIAWGVYSVLGKKSRDALYNTFDNFFKAFIFVLIFMLLFVNEFKVDLYTSFLAIISGAITSALGYLIWYEILPQINITTASVLQLLVPVIAIFLSVVFLDEILTVQLVFSTILILFGIFISLYKVIK